MKVLLLCDDHYHPGDVPTNGVKPLEAKGFSFDVISDATNFDAANLKNYDCVIMSKCDHISKENNGSWKTTAVQQAFVDYVEAGGGFVVTHNGTVKGENTEIIDRLAGCTFANHPNNCPVTFTPLKPHPITAGVESFVSVDEHYRLDILADDIDILAASYAPAMGDVEKYATEPYFNCPECIAPSAYVRTQGKGRIAVLTPGHDVEVWLNPNFQTLLTNTLHWCAGKR